MKNGKISHRKIGVVSSTVFAICAMGCASQQPASQLVEARQTYEDVESGKAQEYAPDELLEAKTLLQRAEEAKNGSKEQVHLAYLADRQARLARSSGSIEYYQNKANEAEDQYITRMEERSQSANERLEATEEELARVTEKMNEKDANVEELSARKSELETRKQELETKLSASEQARVEAEKRAQAAMASLNELANVKEEANETVITLSGSVLFKTGKSELLPIAENKLTQVADALKNMDDEQQIVIEGHTDSRGAEDMNKKLSQERAESVMNYLASQGVNSGRMKAVGKGEGEPVASNDSVEGRANNRRVELRIQAAPKSATSSASQGSSGSKT